jgi:hypothetical protein
MLKITAYAQAQAPVANKKDGWGLPRQTVYLKQNSRGGRVVNYQEIAEYQRNFFDMLNNVVNAHYTWAEKNDLTTGVKYYNDPVTYTVEQLHHDTEQHYKETHDPTLSMILRQKFLIRKLAQAMNDPSIIDQWDIDLTIKNPDEPVLKKFYDRDVLTKTAQPTGTAFGELFS